ncbi:hypothetical protein GCM10009745_69060 [Kribbella yunnanensis]|uniref:Uncharacterized protein n=1 Tax=Kribbella yunnanensis TaxID=190194 RepID=A0ABP4USI5_9ACTN
MPEGRRVGLAGFGGAGANPSLEIPMRCHLAFRMRRHDPPAIPSAAVDQDERPETRSPFAPCDETGPEPVNGGEARAAPPPILSDPAVPGQAPPRPVHPPSDRTYTSDAAVAGRC